ncbi:TetR/AcrR family transcriptional regulator [Clostridium akagii]|uniref:TetR/AcrR family transcriptional regulator n=1 Tax=Clostridium akagii TaxID=91623 RepID=UPI00047A1D24|nr:TetR/AcrR family transcriptional regulator [Clostridium akagii]
MPKETFFNLDEQKQKKIINKTMKEFAEKGYKNGNIGTIAKNAGVSKGSMYQYFDDKKELCLYCVKLACDISFKYVDNKIKDCYDMSVFDYIYFGYKNAWTLFKDEREVYVFLQNISLDIKSDISEDVFNIIGKESQLYFKQIMEMIENNKKQGLMRRDISTANIWIYISAVSGKFKEGMLVIAKEKGKEIYDMSFEDFEPFIKDMISLMKNGIGQNNGG